MLFRQYAVFLQRHVHRKLKVNHSNSRDLSSRSSYTVEASIPALTEQIACKANLASNLDRFLSLSAEAQWKAKPQKTNKHNFNKSRQWQGRHRRRSNCKNDPDQTDETISHQQATPILTDNSRLLRWQSLVVARPQQLPTPAAIYAQKQRHESSRNHTGFTTCSRANALQRDSELKQTGSPRGSRANPLQRDSEMLDGEEEKEGQMQGGRSQCSLQVRSTPGGELPD